MGFVLGVLAALLVIFLLTYITLKKPRFGQILIALSLALILLSTYLYFQKDNRVEKLQQLIPVDEIVISDVKFDYAYGNNYKLTGTISNLSKRYRLQSVQLKLLFYKCQSDNTSWQDCDLIDDVVHTVKTRLPANQTASFETYILLEQENYLTLRLKVEILSSIAR